jgi:GDP-4-dehydro-6-deoxy-D-mannose reductase
LHFLRNNAGTNGVRILITGIGGFVGGHLWRHIHEVTPDAEIHGTVLEAQSDLPATMTVHTSLDLKVEDSVRQLLADVQPEHIYHLAAQSSPRLSNQPGWAWSTLETNIKSQLNLMESCLSLKLSPRILIISSGDIYGNPPVGGGRIHENTPFCPQNPYAVSKATQDLLGLQYALSQHLPIMRARPFNHTGSGQRLGFVAPDYAARIAGIESSQNEPVLTVSNPSARRDFSDVRDVVRAYRLLMEKGVPGEAYNIASGKTVSIRTLVDTMLSYASVTVQATYESRGEEDSETAAFQVDTTRLQNATGWQPEIPFEQTLLDVLNDWRQRIHVSAHQ